METLDVAAKTVSHTSNFLTDILDAALREDAEAVYLRADDVPLFRKRYSEIQVPGFETLIDKEEFDDALESLGIRAGFDKITSWVHYSDHFPAETFVIQEASHLRSLNGSISAIRFERKRNWRFTRYKRNPDGTLDIQQQ